MTARRYFPWMKLQKDTYRDPAIARLTLAQKGVFYALMQWAARQEDEGTFDDSDRRALALEVADEDEDELAATIDRLLQFRVLIRRDDSRLTFRKYDEHQATKKDKATARQRDSRVTRDEQRPAEGGAPEGSAAVGHTSVTKRDKALRSVTQRDSSLSTSLSLSLSKQASTKKVVRKRSEKISDPDPEVMEMFKEARLRVTRRAHALLVKVRDKHRRVDFAVTALSTVGYVRETRGDDVPDDEIIDAICSALARYDHPTWGRFWRNASPDIDRDLAAAAWDAPDTEQFAPCNTDAWRTVRLGLAERLRGTYPMYFGNAADQLKDGRLVLTFLDEYDRDMAQQRYGEIVSQQATNAGYPDLEIEYAVLGQDARAAG